MSIRVGLAWVCALVCLQPVSLAETAKPPATPTNILNQHLPPWVKLSGEMRYREEGFLGGGFREGNDDIFLLQRYRLGVELQPLPWLRVFAQGQDARVYLTDRVVAAPPYQNSVDLRQAWVQIGDAEKHGLNLRIGRQDLQFGEERLVGAGNWGNVARSFDAVRLGLRRRGYRADVFAASVVVARDRVFDRHVDGDNLHGVWGGIDGWIPQARIEPFVFWRIAPRVTGENGLGAGLDSKTPGVRIAGQLPAGFEYTTEMALQRGSWAGEAMSSWAGLWRFGRVFENVRWKPRLRVEMNHASGDRDPADGRHGTFDLLYPTPHDKYGLADQVGWKNINHLGLIAEVRPWKSLAVQVKGHTWRLVSARDGVYSAGGALLARDPAGVSGKHVGEEVDFQAIWTPAPYLLVSGGVGHLFPGEFLKKTSPGGSFTFPYIALTYSF